MEPISDLIIQVSAFRFCSHACVDYSGFYEASLLEGEVYEGDSGIDYRLAKT